MANSGSILGFVNQLQNMELQMASILMEAAMKLASMTDANVFMLVEHSGGRYFSGKRHLCDSYLSHRLSPIGNDVEMEINPDVSALQERQHPFYPQSSPSSSALAHSSQSENHNSSDSSRKRSSSSTTNRFPQQVVATASSSPSKRRRTSDLVDASNSSPSMNDLKREASQDGFLVKDDVGRSEGGVSALEASYSLMDQSSFDAGNASDDDIICEEEAVYAIAASGNDHRQRVPPSQRTLNEESDALAVISDSDKPGIFAEILQHPKLEAVKQICDESVSDKNSVSSKLLNSLLYDFSKIAAAKCPYRNIEDPKCKQFYSLCFEEIWDQLPNLQILHERGLTSQIGKRLYPIKVACRERFRNNFRTNLKTNRIPCQKEQM